ncbi:MAG: DUF2061 domain-containing protein [Phycisphaerales bacterium]|nr:MAG: DUF2061 domain-containing protein [Phycisphaerales bacterium]
METHARSIFKAVTWRTGGTVVTCLVALLLTGSLDMSAKIGILDTVIKIAAFYVHERLWNRSNFGKMKPPEYQI